MTRAELRWLLGASLAVTLLASLPTLYAWRQADADHVFTGFVYNTEDGNSYIAKMRLGACGEWLFHLPFTPEPHPGAWLYSFHILLGKLAAGLGLSLQLTYHLARVILGLGLLVTIYLFIARFVPDLATRRLAWLLTAVGSGLGWLLTALGAVKWLGDLALDFWVPEAYVFLVIYSLPHLALAEMALLWTLLWMLDAFAPAAARTGPTAGTIGRGNPAPTRVRHTGLAAAPARRSIWPALLSGLSTLVMSIVVPFYPLVLAAVTGVYLLGMALYLRRIPWREMGLAILIGSFAAPVVLYNAWLTSTEPTYRLWANQLQMSSPHPLHYLLGYAPLLLPAVWGVKPLLGRVKSRSRSGTGQAANSPDLEPSWLLPLAWLLVAPLLAYLPFNAQRRLIVLVQVPLALIAAQGLLVWRARGRAGNPTPGKVGRQDLKRGTRLCNPEAVPGCNPEAVPGCNPEAVPGCNPEAVPGCNPEAVPGRGPLVYVAVASLSNLLLVVGSLGPIQQRTAPIYRPGAEIAALQWLTNHSQPAETVLASFEVGNVIPAWTDLRAFAGHGPETLHCAEKQVAVQRFFQSPDDAWRQSLLHQFGVDYVFYGPQERALGDWDPAKAAYLAAVYDEQGYTVYQVRSEGLRP